MCHFLLLENFELLANCYDLQKIECLKVRRSWQIINFGVEKLPSTCIQTHEDLNAPQA